MNTLEQLNKYIAEGMKIFPIYGIENGKCQCGKSDCGKNSGKHPHSIFAPNGFEDATDDPITLDFWFRKIPNCNWGLATGEIIVIDVDPKNGGKLTIKDDCFIIQSKDFSSELPVTRLVKTGSGGYHLYYKNPGLHIGNTTEELAKGIDTRGIGGYVVLPPSIHISGNSYEWENDNEIILLPDWLCERLEKQEAHKPIAEFNVPLQTQIMEAVAKLNNERADNYDEWLNVGMVLHTLGDEYLPLWDTWSRQSEKYESGKCAEKWLTFREDGGLTVNSLFHWAEEDSKGVYIRPASRDAKPSEYLNSLHKMGYSFSMNRMNDRVYVNGNLLSDGLQKHMMTKLRESSYKNESIFDDAIVSEAYVNQFHPIEDYLNSLVWDGKDYIEELCSYFKDKDNIFPLLLRKWLIGAVTKILGKGKNEQNFMLVLDGKQGKGKSTFVWWLGSALPEFYKASPINPEDKDHVIYSISYFIWEVEELGSTFRKADREALKAFLSRVLASVRPPYGHNEINKPVTCSYIGTLNDEGGFLTDPTGNRRFRVCTIKSINWNYTKLNVNNIWAQAVALFKQGETSNLNEEENKLIEEINSRYEVEDPLAYHITKYFDIEPENHNLFSPTAEIIAALKNKGVYINETDQQISKRIGAILTKFDLESGKKRMKAGENQVRGWYGIKSLDEDSELKVSMRNMFEKAGS